MRLMISGGGTGGHIYPALALIEALKKREPNSEVLYVGTEKGLESRIVPDQGIAFKTIKIQGFKRSLSLENFKTIGLFLKSVSDAHKMIKEFHPDVVVGTGGYVSGAVVFAASLQRIPTVIHEQNSVVGVTNKFLSHFVTKIGISFEDARAQFPIKKVVFTGNPRATQVASIQPNDALSEYGLKTNVPTLLIFGGSRGAEKINSATVGALPQLKQKNYQVLFVTGRVHYQKIMDAINPADLGSNVVIRPYISQMPELLPNFEAILGRAGATSIAEITALGIPSILVPSPYVTNDHQTKNARSLVKKGAAELLPEVHLNTDSLIKYVDALMTDEAKRQQMGMAAKKMGRPRAAEDLLNVLESVIKK
ncbi:undecaprenyldiphospho-muramoylpentapeptide beta-N-acetylglucosaminyltransferase [Pediococcus ethanolidurans]|uniref:undecaprenyldiphospho-muramoylpentapeptide beta-N-acetylglucosaminyltransferase n=1 Tax=Pediococcus ethanolidurans TaxID=319653 RepID=UPI001C1EC071|nr:undecaprenyldiphospho-muramoylpentapeptide beta-N-acetylglucosaminyltransferase [Pediococcus ethanolidurans]MBU7554918.1 undecaprenyldiphospho-muramoylpentapeptide beta-N-acetylglucosaminyltransferase [Pediococcus ethanolidurans]MBU7563467.1 undecaprenyldiphospho-muramoylpentapeptide beta-N-acetylglucosaminyltransferase [Pediococcus ethanolidurans]MCT4397084.1 undecaprenyldiphospho-muramoylpentapeptide beta-N-acetylglucosaminyltransferase [Pediococcus ethanolidurans]MCV3314896.1 undecaprenyl